MLNKKGPEEFAGSSVLMWVNLLALQDSKTVSFIYKTLCTLSFVSIILLKKYGDRENKINTMHHLDDKIGTWLGDGTKNIRYSNI